MVTLFSLKLLPNIHNGGFMFNPLNRRFFRGFFSDLGKYIAIFLFLTLTIGFISGFLVGAGSLERTYHRSFKKYNIEYGHFTLKNKADSKTIKEIEKYNVNLYPDFYINRKARTDGGMKSTLRVFHDRMKKDGNINGIDLLEGKLPDKKNEAALDRLYMKSNKLEIGDTLHLGNKDVKITGIIALPDYSAMYENSNEFMFDSTKFGVGYVTDEEFSALSDNGLVFSYAWLYKKGPSFNDSTDDDTEEKKLSDEFVEKLYKTVNKNDNTLDLYVPRYANAAIVFTGDDLGGDRPIMEWLLYILVAVMAFIFAVTVNHSIYKEASVIGTLRASGYTIGELFRHYITMPVAVTFIAAVVGNLIGYTFFYKVACEMYLNSYDFTSYESYFDSSAFIKTTVIPLIILIAVMSISVRKKLSMPPLDFLRHDLGKKKKMKAVKLPDFKFMTRFRIRIIQQNISSYITMFIGILFGTVILMFAVYLTPLINSYSSNALKYKLAPYQYFVSRQIEVDPAVAEKFCVQSLKSISTKYATEDINVYGIQEKSRFYKGPVLSDKGAVVTRDLASKYGLRKGGVVSLKDPYSSRIYSFDITGIYDQPSNLAVYTTKNNWCEVFADSIKDEAGVENMADIMISTLQGKAYTNYFNGYFSEKSLKGKYLSEDDISSQVTDEELTKVARQMKISMGSIMDAVKVFTIALFVIVIYLLAKVVIEKNSNSISMVKILGYNNKEISGLYMNSTFAVVAFSAVVSMVINYYFFKYLMIPAVMAAYPGWFVMVNDIPSMIQCFGIILVSYFIVAFIIFRKIKHVPMDDALKSVE